MLALVDADSIVYSCGFAAQESIWETLEDGAIHSTKGAALEHCEEKGYDDCLTLEHVEYEPLENALHLVKNKLALIKDRTGCTDMRIFLSGEGNYRNEIATIRPYKGNRPDRKPYWFNQIREYLINIRGAEVCHGIEAEDAVGITACGTAGNYVICAIDKDLDMIPGLHFNYQKETLYDVDEETALRSFYMQLLMGDTTDNIVGVPGCGKKTARRLISICKTEEEMYWTCLNMYCSKYDQAYNALMENAQLLWILRVPNQRWEAPV